MPPASSVHSSAESERDADGRDSPLSSPVSVAAPSAAARGPAPLVTASPHAAPTAAETAYSSVDFRKDFFFRRRHGALDWRRVLSVDLESVVRTVDVDALQSNVEHMTFADITEADLAMLTDANFLQLWRLMQLVVEYLLNVQNFLLASAQKREALHSQLEKQLAQERARADQAEEDCRALKREVKYSRRVVRAYEKSMASKWSGLTPSAGGGDAAAGPAAPQKCGICSSAFVSYEFLKGHYGRRHPDEPLPPAPAAAPVPAPSAAAAAEEKGPTAAEFAAWKRDMESSLRRELAEEARKAAHATQLASAQSTRAPGKPNTKSLEDEESVLAKRLGAMEATLAAVLNNNVVPLGAQPELSFPNSRARGLRDDDTPAPPAVDEGSAKVEAEASLKEYFRRQMFDLLEEIKDLKQQQAQTAAQAAQQAAAAAHAAHYQQQHQQHQQQPMTLAQMMSPHAPAAAHVFIAPHGLGGTVPRHVPALHPSPPAPVVAIAASPVALPSSPRAMRSLRDLLESHMDRRFEPFPQDCPGLLSRTPLSETDLVSNLNSFAVISQSVVARGAAGMAAVTEEVEAMGYAPYAAEVEAELEEYVRSHYARDAAGYAEAQKALVLREERNHALHEAWATVRQREAEQHAAFVAQREAMEAAVLADQLRREQDDQRLAAKQAAQQAQALADERRMADQLSAAHAAHRANIAAGNIRPSPIALTPSINTPGGGGGGWPLPTPSSTTSSSSGGVPAYPSPSPASSPLPFNAAAAAQWEAQRQQSQMTLQLPSPASRQAALSGGVVPSPTGTPQTQQPQQQQQQYNTQRQASMRKPSVLAATAEDSDEDEDFTPAASASAATVGAGSLTQQQQQQRQQQQQQQQPLQPRPQLHSQHSASSMAGGSISKPVTPPVAIPARPNKSAIAAASSAASTTYTAGSLPPRVPVDRNNSFSAAAGGGGGGGQQYLGGGIVTTTASSGVQASQQPQQQPPQQQQPQPQSSHADEVQAFSVGGSNTSSPGLRPSAGGSAPVVLPDLLASPVVSMDQVSRVRQPTRRLGGSTGAPVGGLLAEEAVDDFVPSSASVRRDSASTNNSEVQPFDASASSSASSHQQQQSQQGPPALRPAAGRSILKHYPPGSRPPIAINQSLLHSQSQSQQQQGVSPTDRDREAAEMLEEPSREYEHSTARQDRDPGPEHEFGGLDEPYEDRDAQHLFSPPLAGSTSPLRKPTTLGGGGGQGGGGASRRMSETEELDASVSRLPLAPGSRTRSVGSVAPSSSSSSSAQPAGVPASRFSGPPVGHSANFSVASSQDWQSGNEIMEDDLEELIA